MPITYSNGKLYTLNINGKQYGGSTCQSLCQRKAGHKAGAKTRPNMQVYKYIAENGGWENVKIILFKNFPCASKEELLAEEDKMIKELKCELNSRAAVLDKEKYKKKNNDRLKEYRKNNKEKINEYRLKNKEKIREAKMKAYQERKLIKKRKNNCDCGGTYTNAHMNEHMKSKKHIARSGIYLLNL